jgi:hypothetical protein
MKVVELLLWNTDRYAHRKTSETVQTILRVTGSFAWEKSNGVPKVMVLMQCSEAKV